MVTKDSFLWNPYFTFTTGEGNCSVDSCCSAWGLFVAHVQSLWCSVFYVNQGHVISCVCHMYMSFIIMFLEFYQ